MEPDTYIGEIKKKEQRKVFYNVGVDARSRKRKSRWLRNKESLNSDPWEPTTKLIAHLRDLVI